MASSTMAIVIKRLVLVDCWRSHRPMGMLLVRFVSYPEMCHTMNTSVRIFTVFTKGR